MDSIKRKWGKPGLDVQVFTPEEYCHSCWSVLCNVPGYAYQDDNGDGFFNKNSERKHSNIDHTPAELVILKDGKSPAANCFYSPYRYFWSGNRLYREGSYSDEHISGDKLPYSSLQPAFWFAAARNNGSKEHICDLSEGSYWPYKDDYGHVRPNHS